MHLREHFVDFVNVTNAWSAFAARKEGPGVWDRPWLFLRDGASHGVRRPHGAATTLSVIRRVNAPRETVQNAPTRRGLEEGHWRPHDGVCHPFVKFPRCLE